MTTATERFRMPQRALLSQLFMAHGRWWAVGSGVAVAGLVIAGIAVADLRLLICSLALLFLVVPMVMAFLYINYALDPECAFNALPHTLALSAVGVEVTIYPKAPKPEKSASAADEESKDNKEKGGEETEEELPPVVNVIPYALLRPYSVGISSVTVPVGDAHRGFIYVPKEAFRSLGDFEDFLKELGERKVLGVRD